MYKEFVKQDMSAMEDLMQALLNAKEPYVCLQLGDLSTSLRFVETHFSDIKTILRHPEEGVAHELHR
jgi:hypothetical protein